MLNVQKSVVGVAFLALFYFLCSFTVLFCSDQRLAPMAIQSLVHLIFFSIKFGEEK